jgi:predicted transcriptional regulator of viral defense system
MAYKLTHNATHQQVDTATYFALTPVFALDEAVRALAPRGGRRGTVARLKHHLATGRLKHLERGLYAVVPLGTPAAAHRPDPFLAAAAARPDAVFTHHAALELLGRAHSLWNEVTVCTSARRRPLVLEGAVVRFLAVPPAMEEGSGRQLGTRRVLRSGQILETTGPERTLVEGFRSPFLAGGLEEFLHSAVAFSTLDLGLLREILEHYGAGNLWSATGWFLERMRETLQVSEAVLTEWERRSPRSPHYLFRQRRGGTLHRRWNLIVPPELERLAERDEE